MRVAVPDSPDALTPEWLTEALSEAFPGIVVTAAELDGVLNGSAAKARVHISCDGAEAAPESVLVKASFTEGLGKDDLARAWIPLMRMLNESEGEFYVTQAGPLGDRVPSCYAAASNGSHSVLVLEDLNDREGIRFSTYDQPLDADEMARILDVLATLHTIRWDDRQLVRQPLRDSFREGGMLDAFLARSNWEQQMARERGRSVPSELGDYERTTAAIRAAWMAKRSGPQSLIHGDPHVGNFFFDGTGGGLLDWQLFTSGHWASDIVYAVASSMEPDARRAHERDLLKHYLDRVQVATGAAPHWDVAWEDFRRFAIWGVATYLTPGEGVQDEEYLTTVGERHALAAADHDSFALL